MIKIEDTSLIYELYLQTLNHIRNEDEVIGDREVLKILEERLEKDKILEPYYEFKEPSKIKKITKGGAKC